MSSTRPRLTDPCPSGCPHAVYEHNVRPDLGDYPLEQLRRLPRHVRNGGCSLCDCPDECLQAVPS